MHKFKIVISTLVFAAIFLISNSSAHSVDYHWSTWYGGPSCGTNPNPGSYSNFWESTCSWSQLGYPEGSLARAFLDLNASYTVTIAGEHTNGYFALTSPTGILSSAGHTLTVNGTSLINAGQVNFFNSTWAGNGLVTNNSTMSFVASTLASDMDNHGTFIASNGSVIQKSGGLTFTNRGNFNIPSGQVYVQGANQQFNQVSGAINTTGNAQLNFNNGSTLNYLGGTIAPGTTIYYSNLILGPSATASTGFEIRGSSTLTGNLAAGQTLDVSCSYGYNTDLLNIGGWINNGAVVITDDGNYNNSGITTNYSPLTNNGSITIANTAGGSRYLRGTLINTNLLDINHDLNFDQAGTTIVNSGTVHIASAKTLNLPAGQSFTQSSGNLTSDGTLSVTGGGFTFNGGSITGTPIQLLGCNLTLASTATQPAHFQLYRANTFNGNIKAGQQLDVIATYSAHGSLVANGDWQNNGTLSLTDDGNHNNASIITQSGTFTNNSLLKFPNTGGGARYLSGSFVNNGTVQGDWDITFNLPNKSITNNSAFNMAAGHNLFMTSGNQVFNQNAGSINGSNINLYNGTFNYNGGTISGVTNINLSTLNLGASATAPALFNIYSSDRVNGDIKTGQELDVIATYNAHASINNYQPMTNNGKIVLTDDGNHNNAGINSYAAPLINHGQILAPDTTAGYRFIYGDVQSDGLINAGMNISMTPANSVFTNTGTITGSAGKFLYFNAGSQTFNQNAGTISVDNLNFTNGTININAGTISSAINMIGSNFNWNAGILSGVENLTSCLLNLSSAATSNTLFNMYGNSTLTGNIKLGQEMDIIASYGYNASVTSTQPTTIYGKLVLTDDGNHNNSSFNSNSSPITNQGQIIVPDTGAGGRSITGDVVNNGLMNLSYNLNLYPANSSLINNSNITAAAGKSILMNSGNQIFTQNSGAMSGPALSMSSGVFNFNGGTINGTTTLTNSILNLGVSATSAATFNLFGSNYLNGTVKSGQEIDVLSYYGVNGNIILAQPLTNNGKIVITDDGNHNATGIQLYGGPFINNGTLLNVNNGGGSRYISGDILNNGLMTLNWNTSLNSPNSTLVNYGTINSAPGMVLTMNAGNQVFVQSAGSFTGDSLYMNSGSFDYEGGTISGEPYLTNSELIFGGGSLNPVKFYLVNGNDIHGNIPAGARLDITSAYAVNSTVYAYDGLTNNGSIILTDDNNHNNSSFNVNQGTLVNNGLIESDSQGVRNLYADMVNNGTINAVNSLNFNKSGSLQTNNGTYKIGDGATLRIYSTLLSNYSPITSTLTGGIYNVAGSMYGGVSNILNNAADITLSGATSNILTESGTNALAGFNNNAFGGSFKITANKSYTASVPFSNSGELKVDKGSSFNVTGDLTLTSSGNVTQELGGTGLASNGQINVSGVMYFNGAYTVKPATGFIPNLNSIYHMSTYAGRVGTFKTYHIPVMSGGLTFYPVYNGTSFNLKTINQGDVNGDGCIDDTDLLAIINDFLGEPGANSGFNTDISGSGGQPDGVVDDTDLLTVINNFLKGC